MTKKTRLLFFWFWLLTVALVNSSHRRRPSSSSSSSQYTSFSRRQIQDILNYHNRVRSNVVPRATNMLEMRWNNELAARAQMYANDCNYQHSPKRYRRDQAGFSHIGENIYISTRQNYTKALDFWAFEDKFYDFWDNDCQRGEQCGHYTQMAWHWTDNVGCGQAFCRRVRNWSRNNAYFTVCQYGPQGNWNRERPYTAGPSCTRCPRGTRCRYNLCTFR